MKNGQCPKCNSSNVFKYGNGVRFGEDGGGDSLTDFSGDVSHLIRYVAYESYACLDCGYFEDYIPDAGTLQEIQKKWTKIA